MKTTKVILVLCLLVTPFLSCKLGRFIVYNFADTKDYKIFEERTFEAAPSPYIFSTTKQENNMQIRWNGKNRNLDAILEESDSHSFLIIQNDSISYEKYFEEYSETSIVPSFSMAKSFISILIGCAIDDGYIQSEKDLLLKYVPELSKNGMEEVTIKHLLQMTSGLDFNESYYNPFGHAASFYYGTNLQKEIEKLKLKRAPGIQTEYVSGNSQLLGFVLDRAIGDESISSYFSRKIWQPLGMEFSGSWSLDKEDGMEKTFCCVNARTRDFAKIGRLYLNEGNWNGKQLIHKDWVQKSTAIDTSEGSSSYYQYQWWIISEDEFMAVGILGQYIYVNKKTDTIIVRLGKKNGEVNWERLFQKITASL